MRMYACMHARVQTGTMPAILCMRTYTTRELQPANLARFCTNLIHGPPLPTIGTRTPSLLSKLPICTRRRRGLPTSFLLFRHASPFRRHHALDFAVGSAGLFSHIWVSAT